MSKTFKICIKAVLIMILLLIIGIVGSDFISYDN